MSRVTPRGSSLESALEALPVFPLPDTVFFPHTLLPLHVFEPRYRQMTEAVLDGHGHMAVVRLEPESPRGLARVAGIGRLVHHERLPDGRFHILLQGVGRVVLGDELPRDGLLYRRCKGRLVIDGDQDDERVQHEIATLRGCYARIADVAPDCVDALGDLPHRIAEGGILADIVNAAILDEVGARQSALEERSIARRLRCANDALATLLLRGLSTETTCVN